MHLKIKNLVHFLRIVQKIQAMLQLHQNVIFSNL